MTPTVDATSPLGGPETLSIIVVSDVFDRIHYALVLAAAQGALGRSCTLFFSLHACRALTMDQDSMKPGWKAMFGVGGRVAAEIDEEFREKGIADFESLLQASGELGVRFMVCEMGLRALDITSDDLRDDLSLEVTGAVTFLSAAPPNDPMVVI